MLVAHYWFGNVSHRMPVACCCMYAMIMAAKQAVDHAMSCSNKHYLKQ